MLKDVHTFSGYSVNDADMAKQFYSDVLGLTVDQDWMGLEVHLGDNRSVFLYQKDDHAPASYTVLNFLVDDINATIDTLVEKGVVFERYDSMPGEQDERGVMRGKAAGMGPDIAWFKDPAGNVLAVLSN